MRRRSNKSSKSNEEPAEVVSPKKTRRQSRRRKQSTSESDDEPISALMEKDPIVETVAVREVGESEEQIWKVAPSPQSVSEGEIQKLKICLTRPPASPEKPKRSYKKSASHHEDEQPEEKQVRRSSRRGISNVEDDNHVDDEKQEDVDDKGKLKGKSRSKIEKVCDSDPIVDESLQHTQSDDNISDNVQIDPQTVQSDNINTFDGNKTTEIKIQQEEIIQEFTTTSGNDNAMASIVIFEEVVSIEESNVSEEAVLKSTNTNDSSNESASHVNPPMPPQTVLIQVIDSDEEQQVVILAETPEDIPAKQEDVVEEKIVQSDDIEEIIITKNGIDERNEKEGEERSVPDNATEKDRKDDSALSEEHKSDDHDVPVISEQNIEEEDDKSESLNVTNDEIIKMDDEAPPSQECASPKNLTENVKKDDEIIKVHHEIPLYVAPPPRVCVYPKSMLKKNIAKDEAKPKMEPPRLALMKLAKLTTERKRKWGDVVISSDDLHEVNLITSNLIATIYPDCKLLDEDKIKMDISVISSPSPAKIMKEKRKISIEMPRDPEPKEIASKSESKSFNENGTSRDGFFGHAGQDRDKGDQASIIALNRKISIVEDTAATLKPPPSPAKNPVSKVLYISNLVRPFTLKQLKELLERTGKIQDGGFWTDRIKSKCYAYYESAEDAEATRNALHGIHWPIGNGKKLMIEFSTPEDLELERNPPPPPLIPEDASNKVPEPSEKENKEPSRRSDGGGEDRRDHHELHRDHLHHTKEEEHQERRDHRDTVGSERDQRRHVREWDMGKGEEIRCSRSRSRDRHNIHHSHSRSRRTPSPRDFDRHKPHPKVEEPPPQKLMDDLFLKTKVTPCIYWQALTPGEIALKQQQRLERMAEHQRRLHQSSTNPGGLGSGGGYQSAPQHPRGNYGGGFYAGGRRRY